MTVSIILTATFSLFAGFLLATFLHGLDRRLPFEPEGRTPDAVDPWDLQRRLMAMSDQVLPKRVEINKGVLLYWALCMEELGEMSEAVAHAAERECRYLETGAEDLGYFAILVKQAGAMLISKSNRARSLLKVIDDFSIPLSHSDARQILDGTTDLAVVNSGFALSTGLPGAASYLKVQTSNLSKANPLTGKIDKDAGGKWIKGANYEEPDLTSLLGTL